MAKSTGKVKQAFDARGKKVLGSYYESGKRGAASLLSGLKGKAMESRAKDLLRGTYASPMLKKPLAKLAKGDRSFARGMRDSLRKVSGRVE